MTVDITKTRQGLKDRAATELGALSSGEALAPEDDATLDNLVDPLLLQLSIDEVVTVGNSEEIPSEYFVALAKLLANEAAPSFGQQTSPDVKLLQEQVLRRMTSAKPTYAVLKTEYF